MVFNNSDRPASRHACAPHIHQQYLSRGKELPQVVSIEDEKLITLEAASASPSPFRSVGTLCLGHSCHFGLGLFLPSPPSRSGSREPI